MVVPWLAGAALVWAAGCRTETGDDAAADECAQTCGEHATCDPVIDRCYCDPGTWGDPVAGCEPHPDVCAQAEQRVGHSACTHDLPDEDTWRRLSIGHGNHASFSRGAKYFVPAVPDPRLPILIADTNWYRTHFCVLAEAFEPLFPGVTYEDYQALILARETREYYGGTISELSVPGPQGERFIFTVEILGDEDEWLSQEQIYGVYRQLQDRFGAGELSYHPDSPLHVEQAETWDDPPFPVTIVAEAPGPQYEAYTPGLAFGRVRRFTDDDLVDGRIGPFGWQDIVVVDEPPVTLEGVMAAAVTGARQDILTHLNVLSALRGTPNVHVANALDVFEPFEGQLVRLEVLPTEYSVREATVEEAEAHWAQQRPRAELNAPPDRDGTEPTSLDAIPVATAAERTAAVSRYGAKATGLAVLRSVGDTEHVVRGFGVPMGAYFAFMEANEWEVPVEGGVERLTYAATLERWLDDAIFRSDAERREQWLTALREEIETHGVVDPALLESLRTQIEAEFGDATTMVRFRSSSNAEDSLSFNGAGLYQSVSGCALDAPTDAESACEAGRRSKPMAEALTRVWASLWSFGAYEEREYYQLDHRQVGMGMLANPRFVDELANGVALTGNPTELEDPRYTINVQRGEVPVVSSTPGLVAELNRIRVGDGTVSVDRVVQSSLVPEGGVVLDDAQLLELGTLLQNIADVYPVDAEPPEDTKVMLDLEFKITAEGRLMLKQVRPFAAQPYEIGEGRCR